jgi:hypothetical protein
MPIDPSRIVFFDIQRPGVKVPVHDVLEHFNLNEINLIREHGVFDNFNLSEIDLIVWNTALVVKYAPRPLTSGGKTRLDHWERFVDIYCKRMDELINWVKSGCVLIIFPSPSPRLDYVKRDGEVVRQSMQALIPFNMISLAAVDGELIEAVEPFKDQLCSFQSLLKYSYTMSGQNTISIFKASSTRSGRNQSVGVACRIGEGAIVFSPLPRNWDDLQLLGYYQSLAQITDVLRSQPTDVAGWTSSYASEQERKAIDRIADLEQRISELRGEVALQDGILSTERRLKLLFSGTGDDLVSRTAEALRELGLHVVEGPRGRADLLVWDGKRLAASEVKGVDGTAREYHLRQVVTWAAETNSALSATPEDRKQHPELEQYAQKLSELGIDTARPVTDIECRGLMIIGTFRQMPLEERDRKTSFPDPVSRAIERTSVCALTGMDLYCLLQGTRHDPNQKTVVVDDLLSRDGVLPAMDWRTIITKLLKK